jgi:Zn-finger nucleic acid-binding protein
MERPQALTLSFGQCNECQGTWLDLEEIKSEISDPSILWDALSTQGIATGLSCPACRDRPLSQAWYGDSEIDWCPNCKGIFFDAGELDQIRLAMYLKNPSSGPARTSGGGGGTGWAVGELIVEAVGWAMVMIIDRD